MAEDQTSILVIDDDEITLLLISSLLRDSNYKVTATHDPKLGVKMAEQSSPDAIVLDMKMPELDGVGVLKKLQENHATKDIPVLILTQDDKLSSANQAFDSGARAYLIKPLNADLLRSKIADLLAPKQV